MSAYLQTTEQFYSLIFVSVQKMSYWPGSNIYGWNFVKIGPLCSMGMLMKLMNYFNLLLIIVFGTVF